MDVPFTDKQYLNRRDLNINTDNQRVLKKTYSYETST